MNSRRLTAIPKPKIKHYHIEQLPLCGKLGCFDVRNGPKKDIELPPKADVAMTYSITSSARANNEGGTLRSSALAVVRLMTKSNLVGCSTGMSLGLAPRKILST